MFSPGAEHNTFQPSIPIKNSDVLITFSASYLLHWALHYVECSAQDQEVFAKVVMGPLGLILAHEKREWGEFLKGFKDFMIETLLSDKELPFNI